MLSFLKDLQIKYKMGSLIAIMLFLILLLAGFSLLKMKRVADEIHAIAVENLPLVKLSNEVTILQLQSSISLEKAFRASEIPVSAQERLIDGFIGEIIQHKERINNELMSTQALLNDALKHPQPPELRDKTQQLSQEIANIIRVYRDYDAKLATVVEAIQQHINPTALVQQVNELEQIQTEFNTQLSQFALRLEQMTETAVSITEDEELHAIYGLVVISAIALILGLV
ncbi:MAG: methyl-accepting chemotaxis protein, partial [Shewanella sp.]